MPNPSSNRIGPSRGSKRGQHQLSKHDPESRAANLRGALSPDATGVSPEMQRQLIVELLEATLPAGKRARRPPT